MGKQTMTLKFKFNNQGLSVTAQRISHDNCWEVYLRVDFDRYTK